MPRKAIALHVIEKQRGGKAQVTCVDSKKREWETGDWKIGQSTADSLIGGKIHIHEGQKTPSHIGGKILSHRKTKSGRVVFRFQEIPESSGIKISSGWGNEKRIIWGGVALEKAPSSSENATMSAIPAARFSGREIDIKEALLIKDTAERSVAIFNCIECDMPVRPHRGGGHTPDHFEHLSRNPDCSRSHRSKSKLLPASTTTWDIDSQSAIEGYEQDRKILSHTRNAGIAEKCKQRDGYKCIVCSFHLQVGEKFIAEAHHLIPIALGEREVRLDDLVTLCPTCHRIAHTRENPLSISELKKLRGLSEF
jgi:predicted HNH restriction endonuclease